MRRSRLRRRPRINPIGYHPDDVKEIVDTILQKIERLESDLKKENEHFAELVKQKLFLQECIRERLDHTLAKERLLRDGNHDK